MARKFLKIIENTIARYSNGGFFTGDYVKLANNYKSKDSYKQLPDDVKEYVDSYFDTDGNYRVVNIKTSQATPAPGNSANRGDSFTVEVALDTGGGRYDMQGKVALSADLLVKVDSSNGMVDSGNIPDSARYKNKVNIKPRETNEEDEVEITRVTSKGNLGDKATPTELSLPTSNTKIPSSPATSSPAVGDTGNYMS
tara:strand:+ start:608 stop:1198 length:591 start_codon:yes stop_codon:yes gene_type:complete